MSYDVYYGSLLGLEDDYIESTHFEDCRKLYLQLSSFTSGSLE